ncbi:MAG: DUF4326 domain-containing protein [bacterium]
MKVVHCKKESYDIYVGRPSKWGNPFSHKENTKAKYKTSSIKEALDKYRDWIENGEGQYLLKDLCELKGKTLGCWCGHFTEDSKAYRCHGQILIELVKKYCSNNKLF